MRYRRFQTIRRFLENSLAAKTNPANLTALQPGMVEAGMRAAAEASGKDFWKNRLRGERKPVISRPAFGRGKKREGEQQRKRL